MTKNHFAGSFIRALILVLTFIPLAKVLSEVFFTTFFHPDKIHSYFDELVWNYIGFVFSPIGFPCVLIQFITIIKCYKRRIKDHSDPRDKFALVVISIPLAAIGIVGIGLIAFLIYVLIMAGKEFLN